MEFLGLILSGAISLYLFVLVLRAVASLVPLFSPEWRPRGAMLVLAETVYTVTDPPLKVIGRVVKPVRVGAVAIDLGFPVLYFGLILLQRLVEVVF